MKKILFIALLGMLMPYLGFTQQSAWTTYSSAPGHFSISFPGTAQESVDYDSSGSSILAIHFANYEMGEKGVLMAGWVDFTNTDLHGKTIKTLLEDSRDGALNSMKATDIVTTTTVLTGEPYIEFTFKTDGFVGKERIYVINKIQYSVIALFTTASDLGVYADKFLHSYKHLQ